jgi:hypothetical protein
VFRPACARPRGCIGFGFGSHHDQLLDLDARFALTMLGRGAGAPAATRAPGRVRAPRAAADRDRRTRSRSKRAAAWRPDWSIRRFEQRIDVPAAG